MKTDSPGSPSPLELEDYLLLAPVLLLPWAFGGVEIWAYRSAALLLVAAAAVSLWKRGFEGWGIRRENAWLLPAFLLALWGAVQLLPLPPAVLSVVSPEAHRTYAAAFPAYDGTAPADVLAIEEQALERVPEAAPWPVAIDPVPAPAVEAPACLSRSWRTISLQPSITQDRLAWYVALLLAFVVARQRLRERSRFRAYRWALFGMFALLALFSLVQLQFWNGKIYWVRRVLSAAHPFGPYANPTNLAGVMELAVPALTGLAWSSMRRTGRQGLYEPRFLLTALGAMVCFVAGLAAASKMGAVMLFLGLLALGLTAAQGWRKRAAILGLAVILIVVGIGTLSTTRLGERAGMFVARSDQARILGGRLVAWDAGREMFADYPVTGAGFGAFGEAFARYLPSGAANRLVYAHNDYVQLLLEGGLVAGLLVLWLGAGYVRRAVAFVMRSRPMRPSRVGLAVAVASLAMHAMVDFNHQIPANGLLWVVCCALLLPESRHWRSRG